MAMKQILDAKVVKLRRKELKCFATDKNKNDAKFKFQGQSARSQPWFNLELNWVEINFSTREPDFYKKLFKVMTIRKTIIRSKHFKFQSEMQNVQNHLSFKMTPKFSSIVKKH